MRINTALMPALLFMLLVFVALMGAFVGDGADQKEKLRIGVIAPLSGVAAEYGAAISNGITLAQAELPAVHERIEFLFEDTPYASKAAVSSFQKLRTADRVDAVYVMGVSFCDAVAPLAESAKLPMIAQCVQRSVTAGRNFVLRFFSPADKYAQAVIYYLKAQGLNRLGVVIAGNTYVEEMLRALIENALPSQEITTIARYQAEDTDFRAAITKIKHSQYDAIAVLLNAGQIASFYRQLAEQEVTLPTIGTNWFETESEIQAAGGTMENA
ncbi:MAG TPA: ABC transporter substrate-binding protein, partial [Oligoflexia bacterium]|nr:ABC transporter substrate-binding protein [Oligoflexia bacterium]